MSRYPLYERCCLGRTLIGSSLIDSYYLLPDLPLTYAGSVSHQEHFQVALVRTFIRWHGFHSIFMFVLYVYN